MNLRAQITPALDHSDLDLTTREGQLAWSVRLSEFAKQNVARQRARMMRLGVIDSEGKPSSTSLPADMQPHSTTSTDT